MRLTVGLEAISSYKRLSYTTWHALAEFVDNSTQSYFDNRKALDESYERTGAHLTVSILYNRDEGTITIGDNSIGMTEEELEEALKIAARPPREKGRSKYGMGMKTAACWFGDLWSVKTTKLGHDKAITVTVDVTQVAAGNGELEFKIEDADPEVHYTEVTISRLHRRLQGRTVGTVKDYLRSIYRCDLRSGTLSLLFQGDELSWEGFENRILRNDEGQLYRKDLGFKVFDHDVTGWVAVLESGGRPFGGFSILQNERVIKGYPEGWRPRSLFGQLLGSNDTVNQRLCGELNLDTFQVSHTKDDIIWQGDEEQEIEKVLEKECRHFRTVAKTLRKGDKRGPSDLAIANAVSQIEKELSSEEMIDMINLTEIPPEQILRKANEQTVDQASRGRPRFDVQVGDMRVKFYVDSNASNRDPYYALDWRPDGTVEIAINRNHDYMVQLGDDVADFIRQCIYDGIAEFKAKQKRGRVEPDTIRFIKDNLLRVSYRIHDEAPEMDEEEEMGEV